MLNNTTLAAILLICAGIIYNYSFMCRKLRPEKLKVLYPTTPTGKLIFDSSGLAMAAAGLYLAFALSLALGTLATIIYFLLLPFVLQPPWPACSGFTI